MIQLTFAEVTNFTQKLKLSQLIYFTRNFLITEYETFHSLFARSYAISICLILKPCLRDFKGRLFERIFLDYLFYILTKVEKDTCMLQHFIIVSKSQTFLYQKFYNDKPQAIVGFFYICRRSDKKTK